MYDPTGKMPGQPAECVRVCVRILSERAGIQQEDRRAASAIAKWNSERILICTVNDEGIVRYQCYQGGA